MTEMTEKVAALVADVRGGKHVAESHYGVPLKELGLDSLDVASLFLAIHEKLGVRVPDADIDRLETVLHISGYLDGKR